MANYLVKTGRTWSVKVAIPEDVQPAFGKRAFKQSLKTSDKAVANVRAAPLIARFKDEIAEARGHRTQHLQDYLKETQDILRQAKADPSTDSDATAAVEFDVIDTLLGARKVSDLDELSESDQDEVVQTYKIVTGQVTVFDDRIDDYLASRKVASATLEKERRAIQEFAKFAPTVQKADRKAVRAYVRNLIDERGLSSKTVRDRLSFLNIYWKWLIYQDLARDDAVNPFTDVDLPKGNRKEAVEQKRRPFTVADIRKIHSAIMATGNETLQAAFMIAIYTGCRVGEITSLRCEDVTADTITVRQAKTTASNREVPIHDALKPLMQRLKAQSFDFILPNLKADKHGKRSQGIRRHFRPLLDRLGFDGRHVFHSTRYTVTTLLEQADVPEGISVDILGHKGRKGITYNLYSGGTSFDQKRQAIMKLDYGLKE